MRKTIYAIETGYGMMWGFNRPPAGLGVVLARRRVKIPFMVWGSADEARAEILRDQPDPTPVEIRRG